MSCGSWRSWRTSVDMADDCDNIGFTFFELQALFNRKSQPGQVALIHREIGLLGLDETMAKLWRGSWEERQKKSPVPPCPGGSPRCW